ncbi:uncharacterized protein AMSG_06766 [Thecamonas trahens ATCC 50062]|uniref:Uncharacterized protein n=1 Tax=Thecamonas trahens ATCC 50062 TaxID=461836 RepID=A0A0L0DFE2_THETB|nr:hypothetical protein AMSG_06766 [Thecamonas trahens ATCC 50062]KNC50861.1 hypothetical protein AMSG_06766 [Thecamonas trahens ATCC 50062]|eukprot:XP_013756813.1 hypothetical protein AMSG_06766 [Thecamonas trahens ATCC 50062]
MALRHRPPFLPDDSHVLRDEEAGRWPQVPEEAQAGDSSVEAEAKLHHSPWSLSAPRVLLPPVPQRVSMCPWWEDDPECKAVAEVMSVSEFVRLDKLQQAVDVATGSGLLHLAAGSREDGVPGERLEWAATETWWGDDEVGRGIAPHLALGSSAVANLGPSNGTSGTRGCWGCYQPSSVAAETLALGVLNAIAFPMWRGHTRDNVYAQLAGQWVIGVHLRMESDWPTTIDGSVWLEKRIVPLIYQAMATTVDLDRPAGCTVFVATGLERDSGPMRQLAGAVRGAGCWLRTKAGLVDDLESLSLTERAAVDMSILTSSAHMFIGHCDSSLTFHVLLRRALTGIGQTDACWSYGGYSSSFSASFFERFYFTEAHREAINGVTDDR